MEKDLSEKFSRIPERGRIVLNIINNYFVSSQTLLQILNNRNKAEAQLAKSLMSFREKLRDAGLKCICAVVTPHFYAYPKFNASTMSRKIAFLKKYKCELVEVRTGGNESYDLSK